MAYFIAFIALASLTVGLIVGFVSGVVYGMRDTVRTINSDLDIVPPA